MKNKLVRQAVNYAVDKNAIVQILGGKRIAATTNQVILPGNVGYIPELQPLPEQERNGDPDKAQRSWPGWVSERSRHQAPLLDARAVPPGRSVAPGEPRRAGFRVKLIPATRLDFYGKYMLVPSTAKRGVWDIAPPGWIPDWFGNNGRSVIQPLFTNPGRGRAISAVTTAQSRPRSSTRL